MSSPVRLSLPFPPTVNNLFANNAKGHGRHKTGTYTAWEFRASLNVKDRHRLGISSYALAIALRRPDKRARDLGNYEKAISDLLVKHGVIADDSGCERLTMQWDAGMHEECVVIVIPAEEAMAT